MKGLNDICISMLENIISALRSGNSNVTPEGLELITDAVQAATNQKQKMSTEEAIQYLRVSRVGFYDMKRKGIIKGEKGRFQKTTYYSKKELDKVIASLKRGE